MALIVVKLGSSIVAEDSGDLRAEVVERICEDIATLWREGHQPVIVTSGAIARGMRLLELPVRPRAIDELQAASAVGQGKLYRTYDELMRARGIETAQVLLTFFDVSARSHYLNARRTLRRLLDWRIVPIVNENDTTTTDEISFGDNDFLAAQVAVLLGAELLVLLTDTDGLHSADPRDDPKAKPIREVSDFSVLRALEIGHRTSPLGSGGMRSKVVAAEMATAAGTTTVIGSGLAPGTIARAAAGQETGTRFPPQAVRHSSFKLWLKYAKPSRGTLTVDAGAAAALQAEGTSLLPVGVVDVSGAFEAGDAVDVCLLGLDEGAEPIGKGISNYSAIELRQVLGKRSSEVRQLLPRATEEAVHRDYFVLA